jgi:tetratricopeptide (TPR) repeat protein
VFKSNPAHYDAALSEQRDLTAGDSAYRRYCLAMRSTKSEMNSEELSALSDKLKALTLDADLCPLLRMDSGLRHARLIHRGGDRLAAAQAYMQLLKSASGQVRSNALAELAGISMELAESGKGTHEEVRELVAAAKREVPMEADVKANAVMDLIALESWSRQPESNTARAIELTHEFIETYTPHRPKIDRELALAYAQEGMYHDRLGNAEAARLAYEKVLSEFSTDVEEFAGVSPHARAAMYEVMQVLRARKFTAAARALNELAETFPDDAHVKQVREVIDLHLQRNAHHYNQEKP